MDCGGAPVVVKLLEGTQGIGVILAETHASAKSVIEAFLGVKVNLLVQEFVKEAKGVDIQGIKDNVEKAIGADILFGERG